MSAKIICDGCDAVLEAEKGVREPRVITGMRANNLRGGGLPDADFDWCLRCAKIAFDAVKEQGR